MSADEPKLSLAEGMARSGMGFEELWWRQLSIGGHSGRLEVEAYVLWLLIADTFQHDVLAQALNERFLEQNSDHLVGYRSPILRQ